MGRLEQVVHHSRWNLETHLVARHRHSLLERLLLQLTQVLPREVVVLLNYSAVNLDEDSLETKVGVTVHSSAHLIPLRLHKVRCPVGCLHAPEEQVDVATLPEERLAVERPYPLPLEHHDREVSLLEKFLEVIDSRIGQHIGTLRLSHPLAPVGPQDSRWKELLRQDRKPLESRSQNRLHTRHNIDTNPLLRGEREHIFRQFSLAPECPFQEEEHSLLHLLCRAQIALQHPHSAPVDGKHNSLGISLLRGHVILLLQQLGDVLHIELTALQFPEKPCHRLAYLAHRHQFPVILSLHQVRHTTQLLNLKIPPQSHSFLIWTQIYKNNLNY